MPAPSARRFRVRGTTLAALALVGIAFLAVTMHASLAENQLRLDHVNNSIAIAERRNQVLRLDVAELEAPERVVSEAERLGLRSPQQVTFLSSGGGANGAVPVIPSDARTASTVPAPGASTKTAVTVPTVPAGSAPSTAPGADTTVLATSMATSQSTVPLAGGRVPRESTR